LQYYRTKLTGFSIFGFAACADAVYFEAEKPALTRADAFTPGFMTSVEAKRWSHFKH
jgi:hypothetical protein